MYNLTPQNCYITPAFTMADITAAARTGIRVAMRDFSQATFIGLTTEAAGACTYTFNRYSAVSSGTTEVWDVLETTTAKLSTVWRKTGTDVAALLTVDNFTQIVATTSSTVATTAGDAALIVVNFHAGDLSKNKDAANAAVTFTHIGADTSTAACLCSGFWILSGARYAKDTMSVTLP